jgi:chemotaxis protein histidine kinase CheA
VAELTADQRRQLERLREAYEAELPEKLLAIARAAAAARLQNWDPAGVRDLHRLVHRLAGSAAIWGFTDLSHTAGQLEEVVLAALEGAAPPTEALSTLVPRLVDRLQHLAAGRLA